MRNDFDRQGFALIRGFFLGHPCLQTLSAEVEQLGRLFVKNFEFLHSSEAIGRMSREHRSAFYRGLRYLPSVTQMACHPMLLELSRDLGLRMPAVMHSYNLRMDLPKEDEFLFHWHQDSTYLLGSQNALTYWIPLVPVSRELGSIAVVPGSHQRGLLPFRYTGLESPPAWKSFSPKDVYLVTEPDPSQSVVIEAEPGDVVVFNQLLLHASLPTLGPATRWTLQVRHADLAEPAFMAAGFPMGDATNILHHQYLPGHQASNTKDAE